MKYIDQQGFDIKLGVAYLFVFAMPGPDCTAFIVEGFNEDGTLTGYDPVFKHKIEDMKPSKLWRPLKYTWEGKCEKQYIIVYASESALDLT